MTNLQINSTIHPASMKPYLKAFLFIVLLNLLDFLFRKGFIGIPIPLPKPFSVLVTFLIFALAALITTRIFIKSDGKSLSNLGISLDAKNYRDFGMGLIMGIGFWALVSFVQGFSAGFSWELRPDLSLFNLIYGLVFIFIADLGTELFDRGYALTKFKDSFSTKSAIIIMVFFVSLRAFPAEVGGELLFYSLAIPALHTIFFSLIYLKTKRLGGALGVHTGANFVTISIFDLRPGQEGQAIPSGLFQANTELEELSIHALQLPWVLMAAIFCLGTYLWWRKQN